MGDRDALKAFVGGLKWEVNEARLKEVFGRYGVTEVKVCPCDLHGICVDEAAAIPLHSRRRPARRTD